MLLLTDAGLAMTIWTAEQRGILGISAKRTRGIISIVGWFGRWQTGF
jgi:hypothetical protein